MYPVTAEFAGFESCRLLFVWNATGQCVLPVDERSCKIVTEIVSQERKLDHSVHSTSQWHRRLSACDRARAVALGILSTFREGLVC